MSSEPKRAITPAQVRAARGLVNWSARALAERSKLGLSTVQRFEGGGAITAANLEAIQTALETAGAQFIAENGGGAGVRLAKPEAGG